MYEVFPYFLNVKTILKNGWTNMEDAHIGLANTIFRFLIFNLSPSSRMKWGPSLLYQELMESQVGKRYYQ